MAASKELTSLERDLFKYAAECKYGEVRRLITEENVFVNCVDHEGMTPLQHAAYKGNYNMCKLLLDCGANVNYTHHISQYSSLTFAGLSGKMDVVSLLLEYGASTTKVNSINKTAAQMAAFVGHHNVVNIINNFIPVEDIEYFTKIQGFEKEPKLPPFLCAPVHKLAIKTNIHPICIVMYVQDNICIFENSKKVIKIFSFLSEKLFKSDGNELLSLKFHHLAFMIRACQLFIDDQMSKRSKSDNANPKDILNRLIKCWIKGDKNGFPVVLEKVLHQDVKEYPFAECGMFRQLVRTLGPVKIGEEPSAITIINEVVNGQRGTDNTVSCATCGEPSAEKKCSACKSVYYCSKICQKLHWFTHKTICANLLKIYQDKQPKAKDVDPEAEVQQQNNEESKEDS